MSDANGIKLHMGLAEWSMLIVLSILWGGSYFFIEIALTELSPLSIVAIRIFIAAIIMWIIVLAQLAIVGAALAYAISGVYGRRFTAMGVNPIVAPAGQLTASSLILLLLSFVFDAPIELDVDKTSVWLSVLALAVLSTAFAYVLYFRLLERAGATNLLLVTLLIPVTSIILGSLVLGEILHALHFAGMAVIALGLSVIDGRLWSRKRRA